MSQLQTPNAISSPEQGFDILEFWIRHRKTLQVGGAAVLAAAAVYAGIAFASYRSRQEAAEAFAVAQTPEQLSAFIASHKGMTAAGNAALLLSGKQRAAGQLDDALKTLREFLASSPEHPMAAAARLGIGSLLEAQGKQDEALAAYRALLASDPRGFAAPAADLRMARIYGSQNKFDEARSVYENLQSQFPTSVFANEALLEAQKLSVEHPQVQEPTIPLTPTATPATPATPLPEPSQSTAPVPAQSVAPAPVAQ